ncbi:MAG: hypothetical protein NUV81_01965 [bacterium]|nr:hypothetical protein [bacterium]
MQRRKRKRKGFRLSWFKTKKKTTRWKGTPNFWAVLTIFIFPITLLVTDWLGFEHLWPFIISLIASITILAIEIMVRGRIWIFEDEYIEYFHHTETPKRIFLIAAGSLLILETALILVVTLDRRFDDALLALVHKKECALVQNEEAQAMCRFLQGENIIKDGTVDQIPATKKDSSGFALRQYAGEQWFENEPLVTCAERKIDEEFIDSTSEQQANIMTCTSWKLNDDQKLQVKATRTAFTGALLSRANDGLYRVLSWSDDPNSKEWAVALGGISTRARRRAASIGVLEELRTILYAESLGRAQEQIEK